MTSPKESLTQFSRAHLYLRTRLQNDQGPLKELQRSLSQLKEDPPEDPDPFQRLLPALRGAVKQNCYFVIFSFYIRMDFV